MKKRFDIVDMINSFILGANVFSFILNKDYTYQYFLIVIIITIISYIFVKMQERGMK